MIDLKDGKTIGNIAIHHELSSVDAATIKFVNNDILLYCACNITNSKDIIQGININRELIEKGLVNFSFIKLKLTKHIL